MDPDASFFRFATLRRIKHDTRGSTAEHLMLVIESEETDDIRLLPVLLQSIKILAEKGLAASSRASVL
jgi:hypothetical protein